MLTEQYEQTLLPNGIRVITETMPHVQSAAIGIWVRSGPCYETAEQAGISHFVEHMLFKGTATRSARQINESLYPVGGHLNAFTDREFTCYSAVVLRENIPLAIEVLADMLTGSVFAAEELEREKNVVLEEIRAIEDTPEDLVHDVFASTIWPQHPLGRPVIGRAETVAALTRDAILDYVGRRYASNGLLVAAAGSLDHQELVQEVSRWMGRMGGELPPEQMTSPHAHADLALIYRKTEQAHLCLGMPSFPHREDANYPLIILDTVLGGGPHSRLFDEIRENRGLAYSVGSGISAYTEGGLFSIYASTSPASLEEVLTVIREQLDRVVQEGLSEAEIDQARRHIRASLLLSHESSGARLGRLANSQLYFGRMVPFQEVIDHLNAVTPDEILRTARQVLRSDSSAVAIIGPLHPQSREAKAVGAVVRRGVVSG